MQYYVAESAKYNMLYDVCETLKRFYESRLTFSRVFLWKKVFWFPVAVFTVMGGRLFMVRFFVGVRRLSW